VRKEKRMKRSTLGGLFAVILTAQFAVGTFYAQEYNAGHHGQTDESGVPEIFCNHLGTGSFALATPRCLIFEALRRNDTRRH
jgi:hypothetical protein